MFVGAEGEAASQHDSHVQGEQVLGVLVCEPM